MGNDHGEKPGDEFDNKTFLLIRTHPADVGTTPLSSGLQWWLSPDITIIRPGGVRGTEGKVGENDQVEVVVSNYGGIDAVDAYVEAFLADPSTAFTPATATPVGSGFLTVPNHNLSAIAFPWTPTAADAGHRCMLARVSLAMPFDSYTDPAVFDVVGDRHVAQRNLSVAKLDGKSLSFGFFVVNPAKQAGTFTLRVTEVRAARTADLIRGAVGCPYAQFGQSRLTSFGLSLGETLPLAGDAASRRSRPVGVLRKSVGVPKARSVRLALEANTQRRAVLTVARNPDIRRGDLNVLQVEQLDAATRRRVGGLWVVVQH